MDFAFFIDYNVVKDFYAKSDKNYITSNRHTNITAWFYNRYSIYAYIFPVSIWRHSN